FPEHYKVFAQTEFNYADRAAANRFNRNPLLKLGVGADGLKTGHTTEAGYGLVGSAEQAGRRIIFAMTGLASETERAEEAERIVNWAFRQFVLKTVVKSGQVLTEAEVFMGAAPTVGLVAAQDITLLVPALVQEGVQAEVIYTGPLTAPITKGQQIGELVVHVPDLPDARVPLLAQSDVAMAGFVRRLTTTANALLIRYAGTALPAT
ncbi:MAG: D-alanyl-D-alanine carboxypeptidase, partial [Paracoccaceae bacterium]|nr:D-alanyl-D-alanine carboxypeptidase [Paracoccaceae bacterium]